MRGIVYYNIFSIPIGPAYRIPKIFLGFYLSNILPSLPCQAVNKGAKGKVVRERENGEGNLRNIIKGIR